MIARIWKHIFCTLSNIGTEFFITKWNIESIFYFVMENSVLMFENAQIMSFWILANLSFFLIFHSIFYTKICDTFWFSMQSLVSHYAFSSSSIFTHSLINVVYLWRSPMNVRSHVKFVIYDWDRSRKECKS